MADAGRLGWGAVRNWRWRWIVLVAVLVGLPIVGYLGGLTPVVDWAIGKKIYKNVAPPLDEELPVTVTSFRSSINMASTIGGMGEGLSCSLPWGIDYVFKRHEPEKERSIPVRQRFRQACVFHDLCYRHGLATYGYTQNDCDELLQEQALRICVSVTKPKGLIDCQIDAKKVAAGVKFAGFKDYRSWDRSTFFEFDPNPYRSTRFFVTRAIDDPFKAESSDQRRPDQLLMMFHIQRGGVGRACINCGDRKMSPEEFKSAGVLKLDIDAKMSEEEPVWIPQGRFYSAPHVAADGDGRPKLVWLVRQKLDNSESCIAVTDPMKVLTGTRPEMSGCYKNANPRLGLGQIDLLSSSPQFTMVSSTPPDPQALPSIVATGLTAQIDGELKICVSPNMREGLDPGSARACHKIKDLAGKIDGPNRWGAFQNFPIVREGRHIYLSRRMVAGQGKDADTVSTIYPLALRVMHQHMPANGPTEIDLIALKKLDITDDYDPMMPITMKSSDMRLMSIRVWRDWLAYILRLPQGALGLHEIDLDSPNPRQFESSIDIVAGSDKVKLHESWARRPILVVETGASEAEKKTQLVLSRSKVTTLDAQPKDGSVVDSAQIEFAVLERPAARGGEGTFRLVRGLACKVTYAVRKPHPIDLCHRAAVPSRDKELATPATRLQGAQLLVGRFASGSDALTLALFDRCFLPPNAAPIIVQPLDIGDKAEPAELPPASKSNLVRQGKCWPLSSSESATKPM
jgi:hypothetical protein